jgi:hypothetical protein
MPPQTLSSPNIFPSKFPLGTVVEAIDEGATRYEAPERLCVSVSSAVRWHQASRSELCECGEIEICVEDSGTGIDDDNMPHLFEVFFTTKPHGLGMGPFSFGWVCLDREALGRLIGYRCSMIAHPRITIPSIPKDRDMIDIAAP